MHFGSCVQPSFDAIKAGETPEDKKEREKELKVRDKMQKKDKNKE